MLFRNGERVNLTQGEINFVKKYFHNKFPVKVVYPADRVLPSQIAHNRFPDKPNSISFDLVAIVKTESGTEEWRYAEKTVIDQRTGNVKYFPKKFKFQGTRFLDENEIELIYFLLTKSEFCEGGKNQGIRVKFRFEDLISEAEKKVEKKRLETKLDTLLYNDKLGLPIDKLRIVAKAMFIGDVDSMTDSMVKLAIENQVNKNKESIETFLELVDHDEEINTRGSIQKVIDTGKLYFDVNKRIWYWKIGDKLETACRVTPNMNAKEALVNLYKGDKNFRQDIDTINMTGTSKINPPSRVGRRKVSENKIESEGEDE